MNVKIIVCTHERKLTFDHEFILPIHCGKSLSDLDLGIQGDNTGDNISELNPRFSELTGMYWAWKNLNDVDIIGVCHYRRIFDFNNQIEPFIPCKHITYSQYNGPQIPINYFERIFNSYDVILHQPYICQYDLETMYCRSHYSEDLLKVEQLIRECYPEYLRSYIYVMQQNNIASLHNLLVMKWSDYSEMCEFLFGILFQLDSMTDYASYSEFQKRLPAIVSERLVMVFIHSKKLKTRYIPFYWIKDKSFKQNYFKLIASRIKNTLLFPLVKLHFH